MTCELLPAKPTLVVWVLYDATSDDKFIKMNPANGSLAIFDNEEAAITAKRLHCGTDYKRCEYYSAPQLAPEVANLIRLLDSARLYVVDVLKDPYSNVSHAFAKADLDQIDAALAAYRQQGGDL